MGCCAGTKATTDPLKPSKQKGSLPSDESILPSVNRQEGAHLTTSEHPPLEPITEQEEPLNLSGRPGWKEPQFINYPDAEQIHVDNSPIHIIYSSDHEYKEPTTYSTIKKNLFKNRPLDNSVIQEVSQENADSYLGGSAQVSKQVREDKAVEEPIQEEQIHVSANYHAEAVGEEQIPSPFSFGLPRV
jgi:hypothetical protein